MSYSDYMESYVVIALLYCVKRMKILCLYKSESLISLPRRYEARGHLGYFVLKGNVKA